MLMQTLEEEEIQCRSVAYSEYPPCLGAIKVSSAEHSFARPQPRGRARAHAAPSHVHPTRIFQLPVSQKRGSQVEEQLQARGGTGAERQGLTLVHFSAQRQRFLWDRGRV